jgi:hypothetical protein
MHGKSMQDGHPMKQLQELIQLKAETVDRSGQKPSKAWRSEPMQIQLGLQQKVSASSLFGMFA